ncbi:MAG: hypothetical protein ABA06_03530 [Parcubacteria bacterium C7867-001]|nr:MAG: hypothetical protein ABA06_03530 [Parcubacteria bacterium C7867-001]
MPKKRKDPKLSAARKRGWVGRRKRIEIRTFGLVTTEKLDTRLELALYFISIADLANDSHFAQSLVLLRSSGLSLEVFAERARTPLRDVHDWTEGKYLPPIAKRGILIQLALVIINTKRKRFVSTRRLITSKKRVA